MNVRASLTVCLCIELVRNRMREVDIIHALGVSIAYKEWICELHLHDD